MKHFYLSSFILLCCCAYNAVSQESTNDSLYVDLKIIEIIHTQRNSNYGAKRETYNYEYIQKQNNASLSEFLKNNSALIIKSYGLGAASNISLRGAGSSQTQILWEGVPLNSITMGEADISLIPIQNAHTITIDHSGFSTNYGSGTFGGVVELESSSRAEKHLSAALQYSQASFATRKYSANIDAGTKKFGTKTNVLYNYAQNNFPYYDYIKKEQANRSHAEYDGYSLQQILYANWTEKIQTKAGAWYSLRHLHLPSIMGTVPFYKEYQSDSSFKSFIDNKILLRKSTVFLKSAFLKDWQTYDKNTIKDNVSLESSYVNTMRFLNSAKYRMYLLPHITADAEIQYNYNTAEANNYKDLKKETNTLAASSLQYKKSRTQANISLRKEYNSRYPIPLLYTLGVEQYSKNSKYSLRANAGKKFRIPTFNDLYWEQWGNPNLLPESGFMWEVGSQQTWKQTPTKKIITDATFFNGTIKNKILWMPQGALWHPMNASQVVVRGAELRAVYEQLNQTYSYKFSTGIDINTSHVLPEKNATDDIKHQLFYVPIMSGFIQPSIAYKTWKTYLHIQYNSKRYYAIESALKQYATIDINVEKQIKTDKITTNFIGTIYNVTNTVYESIRSYPLPLRYAECSIQFLFN